MNSVRKYMELVKNKDASSTQGLCKLEGRQCRQVLNEMAEEVTYIVAYIATRIVPEGCATYVTNPSGIHYRPKAKKNLRAKLLRHRKHLRGLMSQAQPSSQVAAPVMCMALSAWAGACHRLLVAFIW